MITAAVEQDVARTEAAAVIDGRFGDSARVTAAYFADNASAIAGACQQMAKRFAKGARLFAFGLGAQDTDAQHIAVEFVHPVVVGKRALPAVALKIETAANDLRILGRPSDIAVGICDRVPAPDMIAALGQARSEGMLVLLLGGAGCSGFQGSADHVFAVPSEDALLVQETLETTYHVIWELVHVFLENAH